MQKSNLYYLLHIKDCILKIEEYTDTLNQQNFLKNSLVQDAVIRNFEIIGEATKQLSKEFRLKYPDIPWKSMAGLRDKLIHDYIGVDLWGSMGSCKRYASRYQQKIKIFI
jgi:uncharacterized protein with HEPN domain